MVASVGCGPAANVDQLIYTRALQGIGGARLIPSSLAIISAAFYNKERGRAIGTGSGFSALTTAIGPMLSMVAIYVFSNQLEQLMNGEGIMADVQSQVLAGASNLAATEVPSGASSEVQQQINGFIDVSLISGFRFVMYLSAIFRLNVGSSFLFSSVFRCCTASQSVFPGFLFTQFIKSAWHENRCPI